MKRVVITVDVKEEKLAREVFYRAKARASGGAKEYEVTQTSRIAIAAVRYAVENLAAMLTTEMLGDVAEKRQPDIEEKCACPPAIYENQVQDCGREGCRSRKKDRGTCDVAIEDEVTDEMRACGKTLPCADHPFRLPALGSADLTSDAAAAGGSEAIALPYVAPEEPEGG